MTADEQPKYPYYPSQSGNLADVSPEGEVSPDQLQSDYDARVEAIGRVIDQWTDEVPPVTLEIAGRIIAADPATAYIARLEEELAAAGGKRCLT